MYACDQCLYNGNLLYHSIRSEQLQHISTILLLFISKLLTLFQYLKFILSVYTMSIIETAYCISVTLHGLILIVSKYIAFVVYTSYMSIAFVYSTDLYSGHQPQLGSCGRDCSIGPGCEGVLISGVEDLQWRSMENHYSYICL